MRSEIEACDPKRLAGLMEPETVSAATPLREGPGTRIGRYKLLQLIGEGGFGSVFMAEQETPVVRKVALKIIKLGMDTKLVIARFEAERQALAMMDHPNIARVLDAGATETGRPYFVMELVKGIPITDYCNQKRLTPKERLELFIPVCKAVQHAHQKGIIHRDIKPSNVMVTLHDGVPVPKVIDFGIAKAVNQRLTEHTLFTEYRQLIGTPEYTSPEQADISGLDVDTRSDIYSLGVLLYQLLTGTTPFESKELRRCAYGEIQRIIREVEPPKPSTRLSTLGASLKALGDHMATEPKRLSRVMAGELDWIVMKCLEKDRARRYDTASSLASDVQRHLDGEPVEASPPSAAYRFRKFTRKHRIPLAVAALLVTATVVSSWQAIRATRSQAAAVAEKQRADTQASIAEAVNNFLNQDLLGQAGVRSQGAMYVPDRDLKVREAVDRAVARLPGRFSDQPLVEARIRRTIAQSCLDLGEYGRAEESAQKALDLTRHAVGEDDPAYFAALTQLGQVNEAEWQYVKARPQLEQALAGYQRLLGENSPLTLGGLRDLAEVLMAQGEFNQAEALLRRSLEGCRTSLGEQHSDTLLAMLDLAQLYSWLDDLGKEEPLAGRQRALGDQHPDTLTAMTRLGECYTDMRRYAEAEPLLVAATQGLQSALGPQHSDTLDSVNALAQMYESQSRYQQADELYERFLGEIRRTAGEASPGMFRLLRGRGGFYANTGRYTDAERVRRSLIQSEEKAYGDEDLHTLLSVFDLATLYADWRRLDEAEPLYRRALEGMQRRFGDQNPFTAYTKEGLSTCYFNEHRDAEAETLALEALAVLQKSCGERHFNTLLAMQNLGANYCMRHDYAKAVPLLEAVVSQQRKSARTSVVSVPGRHLGYLSESNLAVAYWDMGEPAKAEAALRDVERRVMADMAQEPAPALDGLVWVGERYVGWGDFAKAEAVFVRAVEGRRKIFPQANPETIDAVERLAGVYHMQSEETRAEPLWREVAEWSIKSSDSNPENSADTVGKLIDCYEAVGRPEKAAEWEKKLREIEARALSEKDDAIAGAPGDPRPHAERARVLGSFRQFKDAAAEYAKAIELAPANHLYWHNGIVPLMLQLGDQEGLRTWRAKELKRFGSTMDFLVAHRVAKDVLMVPVDGEELKLATELADRSFELDKTHGWDTSQTKGMADYRRGRYQAAITPLIRSRDTTSGTNWRAIDDFFLAMCYTQLGDKGQADEALAAANHLFNSLPKTVIAGTSDWIVCQFVRREAEELINGKGPATRPVAATQPVVLN
ncbi:MAG TPA: tetratricopeptide repeat protein [Tepidisphaeraceae bacterium]|nr:tetratricopeptide repeat protein [Tepidisphaeraceae bacterium]